MAVHPFEQVDVFAGSDLGGNPVAVVHGATDIDDEQLRRFARWTDLSETTFLLPATTPDADYRVRIFTPTTELPFAGHPTLGSAHAWLRAHGESDRDRLVQQCDAGLIELRRIDGMLAFAAPPLRRSGPVAAGDLQPVLDAFGLERSEVVAAAWADNGPGWMALLLESSERVLGVRPDFVDQDVGLVGPRPPGQGHALELRAFFPKDGTLVEDPVTGSLNAAVAQWLLGEGRLEAPYTARQGTALGRTGTIHVSTGADGEVWIAGSTATRILGEVELG